MKKTVKYTLLILPVILLAVLAGYYFNHASQEAFGIEQLQAQMERAGYDFTVKDAQQDFLPATRKALQHGMDILTVYLFKDHEEMESAANCIDNSGFGYDDGATAIHVDWLDAPHFYKRGIIIVQYNGGDEALMAELQDVMGAPFAGLNQ